MDFVFAPHQFITLTNHSLAYLEDPDVIKVHHVAIGVLLAFMPIIIVSNTFVFWGIVLYPGFHTSNNYLLLSLSVADFLMGAYTVPMYILSYLPETKKIIYVNKYLCLNWVASVMVSCGGSLTTLLFIAIDRYVAVMWPLRYCRYVTEKRMMYAIVCLWTCVLLQAFLPMLGYNNYNPDEKLLAARCHFYTTLPKPYTVVSTMVNVVICLALSSLLYVHILIVVCRQVKKFKKQQCYMTQYQIVQFRRRVNSVKITSCLMFLFIILWLPYVLTAPFKYSKAFSHKHVEMVKVCTFLLSVSNSFVNAPVYAYGREEYMKVYGTMLVTRPCRWRYRLRRLYSDLHCNSLTSSTRFKSVDHQHAFKVSKLVTADDVFSEHRSQALSAFYSVFDDSFILASDCDGRSRKDDASMADIL